MRLAFSILTTYWYRKGHGRLRITDLPAVLIDAKGDILAWNDLATALMGDFSSWPAGQRNVA